MRERIFPLRALQGLAVLIALIPVAVRAEGSSAMPGEQVIKISAKRFEYAPSVVTLKVNVPVVLELSSLDRVHGFAVPDLKLEAEIKPGEVTRIRFTPAKVGAFDFHCNVFCGSGHEEMTGQIVVTN